MGMTVAQYAARRGCAARSVRKAIQSGRIDATRTGKAWEIDPEQADRQWQERTDIAMGGRRGNYDAEGTPAPSISLPAEQTDAEGGIEALADSRKRWSHWRARQAEVEAELAAMRRDVEKGVLIKADEVRKVNFRIARAFRDRMMNIPDRVAAEMAAEGDAGLIHIMLTREIREACLELSQLDYDETPAGEG